jgi:hypothetical protein
VGHHDHRLAQALDDVADQGEDLATGVGVQRAGRLVGEEDIRACDERPGDRDALLLAAGELGRAMAQPVGQAGPLDDLRHPRAVEPALAEPHRQLDVLADRQRRHQIERLEHEPDALAAQDGELRLVEAGEIGAAEADRAARGRVEAGGDVQEGALPGAGRPHHGGERAGRELERHAAQRRDRAVATAVGLGDGFQGDCGVARGPVCEGNGHGPMVLDGASGNIRGSP